MVCHSNASVWRSPDGEYSTFVNLGLPVLVLYPHTQNPLIHFMRKLTVTLCLTIAVLLGSE